MSTALKPLPKIVINSAVMLGCDPEFFFSRDGKVIGSEKVLPKEGVDSVVASYSDHSSGKIVIDGVQAELNPAPNTCRQSLSYNISRCFITMKSELLTGEGKDVKLDFSPTVTVDKEEIDSLSDGSKRFGCAPSNNAYRAAQKSNKIKVNAEKYPYRSAGGHIHLGRIGGAAMASWRGLEKPEVLVPALDVLLGNTCVLIDRDPGNIERRKLYGKAGEYRVPAHGVEYRTLSNFWLRNYTLMSFAFGLARFTVNMVGQSTEATDYVGELMKLVKMKDIEKAINTNDAALALKNFEAIEPWLNMVLPLPGQLMSGYEIPLSPATIPAFKHFAKKGVDYWFKLNDPLAHWIERLEDTRSQGRYGWESFCTNYVIPDMNKKSVARKVFDKIIA